MKLPALAKIVNSATSHEQGWWQRLASPFNEFAGAAITEHHSLRGLNHRGVLSHSSQLNSQAQDVSWFGLF